MTSAAEVDLVCPCCSEAFEGHQLMSTNNFGGQTTDFHSIAAGFEPLHFMISTCPSCGFTAYSGKWPDSSTLKPEVCSKIRGEITPQLGEGSLSSDIRYRFLARISEWDGKEPHLIADQYLRAAWCANSDGRHDEEVTCRRLAIGFFEEALKDPALAHDLRQTFTYLVGELYRRIGERERAAEWFDRAIEHAQPDDDPIILQAAKQQRSDPKEFFREFAGK